MSTTPPDVLTEEERKKPFSLPIDAVQVNHAVFQPRNLRDADTKAGSEEQVSTLLDDLERDGKLEEPITVWKWGGVWWCVDGEHRLKAYQQWKWNGEGKAGARRRRMPVDVVEGSLDEVLREADRENFKTKFNVPLERRMNRGWSWTKAEKEPMWIVEAARISKPSAYRQRKAYTDLRAQYPDLFTANEKGERGIDGMDWLRAMRVWEKQEAGKGDEKMKLIADFKRDILKGCAHRPKRHPEEFIEALCQAYPERQGRFLDLLAAKQAKRDRVGKAFEEGPIL